jgi:hypothetical protein
MKETLSKVPASSWQPPVRVTVVLVIQMHNHHSECIGTKPLIAAAPA